MGGINNIFSSNTLSFNHVQDILNILLSQNKAKVQNRKVLDEIGFINEYNSIITNKSENEMIYYSKLHKILKNNIFSVTMKMNFLEWSMFLFDFKNEDFDSIDKFNQKKEKLKNVPLTKEFFINNIKNILFISKPFKKLLVNGIPKNFRFFIYDIVLSIKYNNNKFFNYEEEEKEYKNYINKKKSDTQIVKDIFRTFSNIAEQNQKNTQILKNILEGINAYNTSGYCQGMNYIAGFLLKLMKFDEVKTFYIFKSILTDIKGYFEIGFPTLKKNVELFNIYFQELFPKLFNYFQKMEIIPEFWVGKWFQTLFTLSLSFKELCIIWDLLIIRGFDFMIFISLAIIDEIEKDLLNLKDSSDILQYIDTFLNIDESKLQLENVNFIKDELIIPLNEIIEKAYSYEIKLNKKNKNSKFVNNNISNGSKGIKSENNLKKLNSHNININYPSTNNVSNYDNKNNNVKNVFFSLPNNKAPISNNNLLKYNNQAQTNPYYSTKILPIYNFNNLQNNNLQNYNNNINNIYINYNK